jgi:hypothetical protein
LTEKLSGERPDTAIVTYPPIGTKTTTLTGKEFKIYL